ADRNPHRAWPARHLALYSRTERHPDDARTTLRIGVFHAALRRQFRAALPRRRRAGEDHGDRDPPLYQRAATPHQIPRSRLLSYYPLRRRIALERDRDFRLVQFGARKGRIMTGPIMLPTDRLPFSPIAPQPPLGIPGGE